MVNNKGPRGLGRVTGPRADLEGEPIPGILIHKKAYTRHVTQLSAVRDIKARTQNCGILTRSNSLYQSPNTQAKHGHTATYIQLPTKKQIHSTKSLKLSNCSEKSINTHTDSQHNENAMKNYQPTGNQYSRQLTIRRITRRK